MHTRRPSWSRDRFGAPDLITGPRPGRMRDRRGRGVRGPLALPGPLSPASIPLHQPAREAFDALVTEVLQHLEKHFAAEPDEVDVVVEEVPLLPPEWNEEVPLSSLSRSEDPRIASRIVLYRLPIVGRGESPLHVIDLVWDIVLSRLGELWRIDPEYLDPR